MIVRNILRNVVKNVVRNFVRNDVSNVVISSKNSPNSLSDPQQIRPKTNDYRSISHSRALKGS